jgi:hypothetical protein
VSEQELEDALMAYLARDDADEPKFQSLTTIFELLPESKQLTEEQYDDDEIEDKERLRAALDQLVHDGMVQSHWGKRDYEASYRISRDGFYQSVIGPEGIVPVYDEPATADSSDWTGGKLIYIDHRVLSKIRTTAAELRAVARTTNFRSQADKEDVEGLCDALVGLCEMAEPDISLIQQVTSHPKFKAYTAFFVFLATIRGALGI